MAHTILSSLQGLRFDILRFLNMVPKLVVAMIKSPITLHLRSRCLSMRSSTVVFISLLIQPREVNKRIVSTTLHFKSKKFYRLYHSFKRSFSGYTFHTMTKTSQQLRRKRIKEGNYFQELVVFLPLKQKAVNFSQSKQYQNSLLFQTPSPYP